MDELTAWIQKEPARPQWYEQRGAIRARTGAVPEAVADLELALALDADRLSACKALAWIYATGPGPLRQPERALLLAEKVVQQQPDDPGALNTLGVVYYQLGRWACAVETLEDAMTANSEGGTAHDRFFLAMCYCKLGEPAVARDHYRQALAWRAAQPQLAPRVVEELSSFQEEAEAVLSAFEK